MLCYALVLGLYPTTRHARPCVLLDLCVWLSQPWVVPPLTRHISCSYISVHFVSCVVLTSIMSATWFNLLFSNPHHCVVSSFGTVDLIFPPLSNICVLIFTLQLHFFPSSLLSCCPPPHSSLPYSSTPRCWLFLPCSYFVPSFLGHAMKFQISPSGLIDQRGDRSGRGDSLLFSGEGADSSHEKGAPLERAHCKWGRERQTYKSTTTTKNVLTSRQNLKGKNLKGTELLKPF